MMGEDDFEDMIDRHGGDVAGWPAMQREAAQMLLSRSAAARAALAEMRGLETMLRHRLNPQPADDLAARRMATRAMRGRQAKPALERLSLRIASSSTPSTSALPGALHLAAAGIAAILMLAAGLTVGMHGRGDRGGDGLDEAPSQVIASALGGGGTGGSGEASGDAISDVD